MKVNPNAYHPLYVDPVVWGKTVAPLATPFQQGNTIPGPSGTAIPTFTLMDIFFGRSSYSTTVGHETDEPVHGSRRIGRLCSMPPKKFPSLNMSKR
jgi:hypothetical protein